MVVLPLVGLIWETEVEREREREHFSLVNLKCRVEGTFQGVALGEIWDVCERGGNMRRIALSVIGEEEPKSRGMLYR